MPDDTYERGSKDAAGELLDWGVRTLKAVPGTSPGRGRGLFAAARIERGEIIDRACTVFLSAEHSTMLESMKPVGDYYFQHPRSVEEGLLVLGLPSLCNHADQANANVRFLDVGPCGWIAELYALAAIPAGAEITYKYRCELWFEEVEGD